jgi:hypothetical protein
MEMRVALAPLTMLGLLVPLEVHVGLALIQVLAVMAPLKVLTGLVPPEVPAAQTLIDMRVAMMPLKVHLAPSMLKGILPMS